MNQHNREDGLGKRIPIVKVHIGPTAGIELSEWCSECCEGLWTFHKWHPIERICEFHFQLTSDARHFQMYWKLAGLKLFGHAVLPEIFKREL